MLAAESTRNQILPVLIATMVLMMSGAAGAQDGGPRAPAAEASEANDRFTRFQSRLDAEEVQLDTTNEKAFLTSLLGHLEIPVASQMLTYSAISLQKALINPRNPRAIYFNDDTYLGFVPGGRIEIVSLDPNLGVVFYVFDRLRGSRVPAAKRTDECLQCHAPYYLNDLPSLIVESVVPGITGGGEKAFRREQSGHGIPFDQRFGGWHVTGAGAFPAPWGNIMMEYTSEGRRERDLRMGELFDLGRYPAESSDILPHLLHEHQVGFVNRMIQAKHAAELLLRAEERSPTLAADMEKLARPLVRYLLFADEVPLPPAGIAGDEAFKAAFLSSARPASDGSSLKQFDLRTRLFKNRCSYMIYSPAFGGLPSELKQGIFSILQRALRDASNDEEFFYLPVEEKREVRTILEGTMPELSQSWAEASRREGNLATQ